MPKLPNETYVCDDNGETIEHKFKDVDNDRYFGLVDLDDIKAKSEKPIAIHVSGELFDESAADKMTKYQLVKDSILAVAGSHGSIYKCMITAAENKIFACLRKVKVEKELVNQTYYLVLESPIMQQISNQVYTIIINHLSPSTRLNYIHQESNQNGRQLWLLFKKDNELPSDHRRMALRNQLHSEHIKNETNSLLNYVRRTQATVSQLKGLNDTPKEDDLIEYLIQALKSPKDKQQDKYSKMITYIQISRDSKIKERAVNKAALPFTFKEATDYCLEEINKEKLETKVDEEKNDESKRIVEAGKKDEKSSVGSEMMEQINLLREDFKNYRNAQRPRCGPRRVARGKRSYHDDADDERRNPRNNNDRNERDFECNRCGGKNHYARDCYTNLNKRKFNRRGSNYRERNTDRNNDTYEIGSEDTFLVIEEALLSLNENNVDNELVLDTGSVRHNIRNANLFIDRRPIDVPTSALSATGHTLSIHEVGTVAIRKLNPKSNQWDTITLTDVRYSPQFARNLISIPCLAKKGVKVEFNSHGAVLYKANGHIFLTAVLKDGLYLVEHDTAQFIKLTTSSPAFGSEELSPEQSL